ncbi:transcription factor S-II, central domain-containing protein [Obelidium mucronatum]|nr:transcription factor S-II, central domain-containing protein [Obelidium mucronatum]
MKDAEIVENRRKIEVFVKESNEEAALQLLDVFAAWSPTPEQLRTTRIGMFMNSLRKNTAASAAVQARANALTKAWSRAHRAQAAAAASATPASATPASATPAPATPAAAPEPPARTASTDSLASAASSAPEVLEVTPDPAFDPRAALSSSLRDKPRDKTVEMFTSALGVGIANGDVSVPRVARQIEEGMFKAHGGVSEKYKSQFRTLLSNLKNQDNLKLRIDVLAGRIDATEMATMTAQDLMSESAKQAKQKAEQINNHWASTAKSTEAVTDEFKCGKCGQRKCTYYQKQTRSADEPMTTFVTCQNCGNKWKFC